MYFQIRNIHFLMSDMSGIRLVLGEHSNICIRLVWLSLFHRSIIQSCVIFIIINFEVNLNLNDFCIQICVSNQILTQ